MPLSPGREIPGKLKPGNPANDGLDVCGVKGAADVTGGRKDVGTSLVGKPARGIAGVSEGRVGVPIVEKFAGPAIDDGCAGNEPAVGVFAATGLKPFTGNVGSDGIPDGCGNCASIRAVASVSSSGVRSCIKNLEPMCEQSRFCMSV